MTTKVFVIVRNNDIKCYHDLKQLCDSNEIPYFSVYRRLLKEKVVTFKDCIIGVDTMSYKTKRRLPQINKEHDEF
jgi:hypothetical protein